MFSRLSSPEETKLNSLVRPAHRLIDYQACICVKSQRCMIAHHSVQNSMQLIRATHEKLFLVGFCGPEISCEMYENQISIEHPASLQLIDRFKVS